MPHRCKVHSSGRIYEGLHLKQTECAVQVYLFPPTVGGNLSGGCLFHLSCPSLPPQFLAGGQCQFLHLGNHTRLAAHLIGIRHDIITFWIVRVDRSAVRTQPEGCLPFTLAKQCTCQSPDWLGRTWI